MKVSDNCLFCESKILTANKNVPIFFNEKFFSWNKCKSCGLIFLLPALTNDDKLKVYAQINYHQKYYFKYLEDYTPQLKIIKGFSQRKFLDFGCGDAGLISFLQKNGYEVSGVEYDKHLVEKLSEQFKEINFFQLEDFWETTNKYDFIHLGDVLEHLSDPINLIEKLKEKLRPDGLFFIEGPLECNPNLGYYFREFTFFIKKIKNKELLRVNEPYHITYATTKNQQLFLKKLQLQQIVYKIGETGWPYIDTFKEVTSPWLFLQYLIAKTSIFLSFFIPKWGNRFTYIGKLKTSFREKNINI